MTKHENEAAGSYKNATDFVQVILLSFLVIGKRDQINKPHMLALKN